MHYFTVDRWARFTVVEAVKSHVPELPAVEPDPSWIEEFEAVAKRPLELRFRYAFIKTYKPVMDDADFRAFDTTAQYREWCEANLPDWLGYGRV